MDEGGWQVLPLGGASGTGKTQLSYPLARRYGVPIVEVDDLALAVQAMTTPDQQPMLHYWDTHPDPAGLSVSRVLELRIAVAEALRPATMGHHAEQVVRLAGRTVRVLGQLDPPRFSRGGSSEFSGGLLNPLDVVATHACCGQQSAPAFRARRLVSSAGDSPERAPLVESGFAVRDHPEIRRRPEVAEHRHRLTTEYTVVGGRALTWRLWLG